MARVVSRGGQNRRERQRGDSLRVCRGERGLSLACVSGKRKEKKKGGGVQARG
jgi:hypothetical protein